MSSSALTIRFGGYQSPASVHTRAAEAFGRHLTDTLDGNVQFDLTGNVIDRGHKAQDLLHMVEDGRLDVCYFSASYLADRVPEMALLDMPFTFEDRQKAYDVLDGPLGRHLSDEIAANTGYRLLAFWDNGFRHFTNSVRPIRAPADCQGLRIRTLFSDLHQEVFRAIGFEPIALDVKDLIAGIEDGTVTAQENPLTNTYNFGIHEKHRHITLSSHFFGAAGLLCNAEAYASWSNERKNAVEAAAVAATQVQRQLAGAEDAEMLSVLADTDVDIVRLSTEERAAFAAAVAPLIAAQRQRFGEQLLAYLD